MGHLQITEGMAGERELPFVLFAGKNLRVVLGCFSNHLSSGEVYSWQKPMAGALSLLTLVGSSRGIVCVCRG